MSANSHRLFQACLAANKLFQTGRPEMPITIVNTFLAIALWGDHGETDPPSLQELSQRLDMPAASMSRHLRYLGDFERRDRPGCGWVAVHIHPEDGRKKIATLTEKGQQMAEEIRRAFDPVDKLAV